MNDNPSHFHDAMRKHGLEPPDGIEPGRFHRFPGQNKRRRNTAGWCIFFLDGNGGSFGDWSTGLSETWQAHSQRNYTSAEHAAFKHRVKRAQVRAMAEREVTQTEAACRALEVWSSASSAKHHPYLKRKRILPLGIRQRNNRLIVPISNIDGQLCSYQSIDASGRKMFLKNGRVKGCFHLIGGPICDRVFVCEGFATGASLYTYQNETGSKGWPVAVAFFATNLKPVTVAIAQRFPKTEIVICADNDHETKDNPGLKEGRKAAAAVGCEIYYPRFDDEPFMGSDFNDLINGKAHECCK